MAYPKIATETVNKNRDKWAITFSLAVAKKMAKDFGHKIYQAKYGGAYFVRKPTGKRLTPEIRRALERSGQYSWR